MDPDLDNIPGRSKCLLRKPKSGKLKNDITGFTGLNSLKIDGLLLHVEHLGRIDTISDHLTILDAGGIGTTDDIFRKLLTEPRLTVIERRAEVIRVDGIYLLGVSENDGDLA